ncbi:ATP-binding protein [Jiangella alba]|nr:ATP-binding protein [Jiangella alba]
MPADITAFEGVRPRRAAEAVRIALDEARVVLVQGARQAGKSTLMRIITRENPDATARTLDDPDMRAAAAADPKSFVDVPGMLAIDEIQRVPELLLAIKADVDERPRRGRFLLTGSARVFALKSVPDALPGRVRTVELWPFSQGEIDQAADGFVDAVFEHGPKLRHSTRLTRGAYAERLVRGGFPEVVTLARPASRRRYFNAYIDNLIEREITEIGEIERLPELHIVLRLLAARAGSLLVMDPIASDARVAAATARRYVTLLEQVFLVKRLPSWSRNVSARATAAPKIFFVDSGVAAHLLNQTAEKLLEPTNNAFGPLLESFVASEISRQLSWNDEPIELSHYRTRDKVEVDLVLEHPHRGVVGVEVKAAATVRQDDFRGLRHLAERVGHDFVVGIVLYSGHQTLSFGPNLIAMPTSALWELEP